MNNNVIVTPSDKGGVIVIMDFFYYRNKIMGLLDDKNTEKQMSLQTIMKNIDVFDKH